MKLIFSCIYKKTLLDSTCFLEVSKNCQGQGGRKISTAVYYSTRGLKFSDNTVNDSFLTLPLIFLLYAMRHRAKESSRS